MCRRQAYCIALFAIVALSSARAHPLAAQQNLFNVPSGRITPEELVFVQQQFNLRADGISNTTIDFGLGNDFEVGLNVLNIPAYNDPTSQLNISDASPDILFNFQQGISVRDDIHLGLGAQIGGSTANPTDFIEFSLFTWAVAEKKFEGLGYVYAGAYGANRTYLGYGSRGGAMLGYEIPVIEERFSLMGDVLTGTNDISLAVVGMTYTLPDSHWQFSLGYQLPFPNSGNGNGAVFEITWLPIKPGKEATLIGTAAMAKMEE